MNRATSFVLIAASLVVCMHSGVAAAPGDLAPEQVLRSLGWLEGAGAGRPVRVRASRRSTRRLTAA